MKQKSIENWTIQFYGTRGSFPLPSADYMEYGGNTICTSVECGCHLILDAGTGLRTLGKKLATLDQGPIHLLISHLHADHIMGLFDFQPFYQTGREIHLYGENLEEQLGNILNRPYWPVGLKEFPADLHFHGLVPDSVFHINEQIQVRTLRSCHPGKCLAFRLEDDRHSLGYALDYELAEDTDNRLECFFKDCDLAIMDGSDIPGGGIPGWGHSSWNQALSLCIRANIGKTVIAHYGPELDDARIAQQKAVAFEQSEHIIFAKEGMTISV